MNTNIIKRVTIEDAEKIFAIIERNREHLKNLKWVESATLESVREYIAKAIEQEIIRAVVYYNDIVGLITLRDFGDHFEIGYWLDHEVTNRGIMTEAVAHMCYLVRSPIFARIRKINHRSRRVLLKNGFVLIGTEGEWETYRKGQR